MNRAQEFTFLSHFVVSLISISNDFSALHDPRRCYFHFFLQSYTKIIETYELRAIHQSLSQIRALFSLTNTSTGGALFQLERERRRNNFTLNVIHSSQLELTQTLKQLVGAKDE